LRPPPRPRDGNHPPASCPMMFRRGNPFIPVVFVAAAVAILVAAALTSWWVLLALIPLAMMVGCMAMMMSAAQREHR
jgi:hypothetical protein